MRLLSAGRYNETAEWFPSDLLGLQSFVALQSRHEIDPPEGVLGDLVRGWANYYSANYPRAFEDFSKAECTKSPWLKAYAWLGKGKVCTDLGFFADAARWCCDASCLARQFEHDDLVAASQGARGEILLRTGHPRLATEAFSLDTALLPASDHFRGRVMCYQAHAYRRLGAYSAAKLAYRTSAQQPGEETAPHAYAALAMLGAETNNSGLIDEAIRYAEAFYRDTRIHPSLGWVYIAKARIPHQQGEAPLEWLALEKNTCIPRTCLNISGSQTGQLFSVEILHQTSVPWLGWIIIVQHLRVQPQATPMSLTAKKSKQNSQTQVLPV